jgi:hypothetical protein
MDIATWTVNAVVVVVLVVVGISFLGNGRKKKSVLFARNFYKYGRGFVVYAMHGFT